MNSEQWIAHLVNVRLNPASYPVTGNVSPWAAETWKFFEQLRNQLRQKLPRNPQVDHFDERVVEEYRKAGEVFEAVRAGVVAQLGTPDLYPLIPGGLIFPELIRLEVSINKNHISTADAMDAYHHFQMLMRKLGWDGPSLKRLSKRISDTLRLKTYSNIQ